MKNSSNIANVTTRMVRKDFKKWSRLCYKGVNTKVAFYKCFLVSCYYNSIFKKGVITRENFDYLITSLSNIPRSLEYTSYENEFLYVIERFETIYVLKTSVDNTKKTD